MEKNNSKVIGVYMNADLASEIQKRANNMQISASKYLNLLAQKHVDSKKKLKLAG